MRKFSSALVLAGALLSSCATLPKVSSSGVQESDQQLVERAWPYAQLAYNAYHRERIDPDARPFILPADFSYTGYQYGNDEIGLAFEVATRGSPDDEVVFIFRGTEGGPSSKNCDWARGNFAFTQQKRAARLVARYVDEHGIPKDRLVFVGHSLGGAIATQLSYLYPGSRTYIFNASPMFRGALPSGGDANFDRRLSIVNRGEFLYVARGPLREATQIYLPVNCGGGLSPISRHSMFRLATCLTGRAANAREPTILSKLARESRLSNASQFTNLRELIDPTNATQLCPRDRPISNLP